MISNAERIVLRNMYPPGCRVELEDMEADPYVKLSPGDLGTVQFVDDAGQIHVSWDCGHSLAMVFGVDHCRCVMREDQFGRRYYKEYRLCHLRVWKNGTVYYRKIIRGFP